MGAAQASPVKGEAVQVDRQAWLAATAATAETVVSAAPHPVTAVVAPAGRMM